jgi:septum formation protein
MIFPGKYRIILASRSPRRQQLLSETGLIFSVVYRDYDETFPPGLSGAEIASWLSKSKADCFRSGLKSDEIVITADTIVWCRAKLLGKPETRDEALNMLRLLSGTSHEVITGVTILTAAGDTTFTESTIVYFDELSENEINYYVDNYKPYDKAGAYGIQEWIGLAACSRIEGSYFNVVGLPVNRVYRLLSELMKK